MSRGVAGTGASSRSPGMCVPRDDRAFLRQASVQSRPPDDFYHGLPGIRKDCASLLLERSGREVPGVPLNDAIFGNG